MIYLFNMNTILSSLIILILKCLVFLYNLENLLAMSKMSTQVECLIFLYLDKLGVLFFYSYLFRLPLFGGWWTLFGRVPFS